MKNSEIIKHNMRGCKNSVFYSVNNNEYNALFFLRIITFQYKEV